MRLIREGRSKNFRFIYIVLILIALIPAVVATAIITEFSRPNTAYQDAVDNGYEGTELEWLSSLISENINDGKSAYEVAVGKGYEGSEQEWLESLIGEKGEQGESGKSAYELAVDNGFKGTLSEWLDSLIGKDGIAGLDGKNGKDGKSAYELAVENGFKGSITEWLVSLVGKSGSSAYELAVENGYKGTEVEWLASLVGENGKDGRDGKSAYELACENGFKGTEADWLNSLLGQNGKSAYELAVEKGFKGNVNEWLDSLIGTNGTNGKSAFEIAQENGYTGTEKEWLDSLAGKNGKDGIDGSNGKSAYELAQENGFEGTLSEWLDSLVGKDGVDGIDGINGVNGKSAYELAQENGFTGTITEWLASLIGENGKDGQNGTNGKSAYELAQENGFTGTVQEWLQTLVGKDGSNGKSAYELAKEQGYSGTLDEWLESLVGKTGNGISSITKTNTEGLVDTYTITYTDGTKTTFTVTNGKDGVDGAQGIQGIQGQKGEDGHTPVITIQDGKWFIDGVDTGKSAVGVKGDTGNGISNIEKTNTVGLVDTYTITYTNGTTTTFTVTNGKGGVDGAQGIQGIQGEKGEDGHTPVITIQDGKWFIDGVDTGKSAEGVKGDTGNGISSITKTNTVGLVDTYTITFTDGTKTTFTVTNGKDGVDGAQGIQGIQGQKGEDGHTPVITIQDGKWFIDGVDTGKSAEGVKGDTGNGISNIEKTNTVGLVDTYTITYTNGTTTTFTVTNGKDGVDGTSSEVTIKNGNWHINGVDTGVSALGTKGDTGATGNGIKNIAKISSVGLVDTYTITYTDDTTFTFTITNGNGIESIEKTNTEGLVDTYTITYTNGNQTTFTVTNAKSIAKIEYVSSDVLVDTYKITYNDNTTSTFTVKNGNGIENITLTSQVGLDDIYRITYSDGTTFDFTVTNAATWHTGEGIPETIEGARVGDFYIDVITSNVYELTDTGWVFIANIRGISVVDVNIEALYDEFGKHFKRYTFTFSDGTEEVIDVYDNNQVYKIEEAEYYVLVASDPHVIPDINLKVIYANSNIDYIPLESWMIMNSNEVHFSIVGEYRLFLQYYNVNAYITIHVLPINPVPTDDSYINETNIIWSEYNFNKFTGLYLTVIWDRPSIAPITLSLTDPNVTITKANGEEINDSDKGKNLELLVTYKGHSTRLNVYWMSNTILKNAKVVSFNYVGEVIHLDQLDITIGGVNYPDLSTYGYLIFELYTSQISGVYVRQIDTNSDKILLIDTDEEFGSSNVIVDQIIDYNLYGKIEPQVTNKYYYIDNTLPIFVVPNDTEDPITEIVIANSVTLSDYDLPTSQNSVPPVNVIFTVNIDPYTLTVPLTINMLDDPNTFKTEGYKSFDISYNYGGTLLKGTVTGVYIHNLSSISASSSGSHELNGYYRYVTATPVDAEMKTTRSSDIIPVIKVRIVYVRYYSYYDILNTQWVTRSYNIEEQIIELTKSTITNIDYLDFSKPGEKEIRFMLNGKERTITIDFYSLDTGVIESITYNQGGYERNAIPSNVRLYDIGYLYLNVSTMKLYDKYSGSWKEFADITGIDDEEKVCHTYTIGYANGFNSTFTVSNGKDGIQTLIDSLGGIMPAINIIDNRLYFDGVDQGVNVIDVDGTGISTIKLTSEVENIKTYTITYLDGTTNSFNVNYIEGVISSIEGIENNGYTPVVTIQYNKWYIDGINTGISTSDETGKGILSFYFNQKDGLVNSYTTSDGGLMFIKYNPQYGQIQYSYDNETYSLLYNPTNHDEGSYDSPWFVSDVYPHNKVNRNDILFKLKHEPALAIGNELTIKYYEPVNDILTKTIIIDESFFDNFDFTGFDGAYVGTQNIKFNYESHYLKYITVEISPRNTRFIAYTNEGMFCDDNENVLDLFVDTERRIIGTKTQSSSSFNDYHGYYVIENLDENRQSIWILNMFVEGEFNWADNNAFSSPEATRYDIETLYQSRYKQAIINHETKTIEHVTDIIYTPVNIEKLTNDPTDKAYFRFDGKFGELKIISGDENNYFRFFYNTYEDGKVIEMDDIVLASEIGQYYLVYNEETLEPSYDLYVGKYGTKYSLDTTGIDGDFGGLTNLSIVVCENNQLYMTYDGMTPNNLMLQPYYQVSENLIYVPFGNTLAKLDNENMVVSMVPVEEYEADISIVPVGSNTTITKATIYKGLDVMTLVIDMIVNETAQTIEFEYHYYEIADNKFDVYLTDNNSVDSATRDLYDNYYLELIDGIMVTKEDEVTRRFDLEYSDFLSFPPEIIVEDIDEAYIEISTIDSMLSIYVDGQKVFSEKYYYNSITNTIYPASFGKYSDTMFSFEIIDDDTAKIIDLAPGKVYKLDASIFSEIDDSGIESAEGFVRLNNAGQCSAYIVMKAYNSGTGKYEEQIEKIVFEYQWVNSDTLYIYEDRNDMYDIGLHLRLVGDDTLKLCMGMTPYDRILTLEGGKVAYLLYESGLAYSADLNNGSFDALLSICFYEYLDEDTILLMTILGVSLIGDIVDGVLYMNSNYISESGLFEEGIRTEFENTILVVHKYKDSNEVLVEYITNNNGNGEEVTEYYMKGEMVDEELCYLSYVAFYDQYLYIIDGQCIMFGNSLN